MLRSGWCESNEKEIEIGVVCVVLINFLFYKFVVVFCGILLDVMRCGDIVNGMLESK